jgi:hypothetical protein
MADGDASIRIKLGQIEIEYNGDAAFLKKDLLATVGELLDLQKQHPDAASSSHTKDEGTGGGQAGGGGKFDQSTDTMANILGASSGPDLAVAAAAHLHLVKGKPKFTRQEIIAEMRTAPGHFKDSFSNNMSSYLNGLKTKDRLRLVAEDTYALSNKEKQALEAKLAQA